MSHRKRPAPFVIVGGGVAGSAAAIELRIAGYRGRVVIVSEEPLLPYRRSPLTTTYLRGEIDRDELLVRPASWYRDAGIDLLLGATATSVDAASQVVEVRGHGPIAYDRLVLATGTEDRLPPLPGAHRVRSIADADAVRRRALAGRSAIVVGGNRRSTDIAVSLAAMGLSVTLLEPRSTRSPDEGGLDDTPSFDREGADRIERLAGTPVLAVSVAGARRQVHTPTAVLAADLVVDARDQVPRTTLAWTAGLIVKGGVLADARGRTEDDRIGAAGAVARRVDPVVGTLPRTWDDGSAATLGAAVARALASLPPPPVLPRRAG